MKMPRAFRWDPVKADSNFGKHGIDFDFARRIFVDPNVLVVPTVREADGEERHKAIGLVNSKLYVAIFTIVESDICRLISARRTNGSEDRLYARRNLYL